MNPSPTIRYQQLANGIHEITFLEKTRASVDEFYRTMETIYQNNHSRGLIRILVDLSMPGVIPMQYMYRESMNWRGRNPDHFQARAVILYPEKGVLPIARALVNAVLQMRGGQIKLHLENINKREEAIEWLLGDKS